MITIPGYRALVENSVYLSRFKLPQFPYGDARAILLLSRERRESRQELFDQTIAMHLDRGGTLEELDLEGMATSFLIADLPPKDALVVNFSPLSSDIQPLGPTDYATAYALAATQPEHLTLCAYFPIKDRRIVVSEHINVPAESPVHFLFSAIRSSSAMRRLPKGF